jgi:hypothetical protein
MNGLRRFGALSNSEAREALRWGTPPMIAVVNTCNVSENVDGTGCRNRRVYGVTEPDTVYIDGIVVNEFETDAYGTGVGRNRRGQAVFIVGVTLLHELCHWGQIRATGDPAGNGSFAEAGLAFERAVYGREVHAPSSSNVGASCGGVCSLPTP